MYEMTILPLPLSLPSASSLPCNPRAAPPPGRSPPKQCAPARAPQLDPLAPRPSSALPPAEAALARAPAGAGQGLRVAPWSQVAGAWPRSASPGAGRRRGAEAGPSACPCGRRAPLRAQGAAGTCAVCPRGPRQLPPRASELKDVGVTFSAKKSPRSLVDMTFDRRGGVLEIPTVESYRNHAIFANLLAYEQCRGRWELQRLVSYVLLMALVVNARRDVVRGCS
ncbi:translation initiation factor IF-2-like [Panicum virgatum]|uniref:translation initiation factor IF-2-like n=1 Tax=Panicum virgatum TaxID=38727 RepID=UPI0019D505FC|nr:translation initiation factor IF-2-like [Panicum virgatum]